MATILSFLSGVQITDSDGDPVSGALLYHYQAGTTNNLTVYQDSDGDTPHAQPVVCDAGGFAPLIYIDDSSNWKVVIQTAGAVTLRTYDNLPAAPSDESATGFAPQLLAWTQVTSASSPVALTPADAGKAYEADTTSGNIEFDLPSASSVGNGKGFVFKKIASANSMIIDPNGTETTDDSSTSITVTRQYQVVAIFSNGAEWYVAWQYLEDVVTGRLPAASDAAQGALEIAIQSEMETATDVLRAVVPGRQHFHPGHPKFWAYADPAGVLITSYNVTSITDTGTGRMTVTIATDFSSANWCCVATVDSPPTAERYAAVEAKTAGTVIVSSTLDTGAPDDPVAYNVVGFGDQ